MIKSQYETRKRKAGFRSDEASRTQQQFKTECDINHIIRRYDTTGVLSSVGQLQDVHAIFGDFSCIPDYHAAMNTMKAAEQAFETLPSWIRKGCKNDPQTWINLVMDPKNFDDAAARGYITSDYKKTYDKMIQRAKEQASRAEKRKAEIQASESKEN